MIGPALTGGILRGIVTTGVARIRTTGIKRPRLITDVSGRHKLALPSRTVKNVSAKTLLFSRLNPLPVKRSIAMTPAADGVLRLGDQRNLTSYRGVLVSNIANYSNSAHKFCWWLI